MSINYFTDLITWQEGHKLVLQVYKHLEQFPKFENYSLSSQIRNSSVSITSNIAEGYGRRTWRDKLKFYDYAYGSSLELQSQLITARDLGYISKSEFSELKDQFILVHKLLVGLRSKTMYKLKS